MIGAVTALAGESRMPRHDSPDEVASTDSRIVPTPVESAVVVGPFGAAAHARLRQLADSGFSGAVIVERNDTLILSAGYGLANRERRIPFTPSTIAQIGSNTKQFTAAAVLDLARRGMVRLTDSLGGYFPFALAPAQAVTIHQLLSHSSGMAEYCGADFARASREEFLRRCLAVPLRGSAGSPACRTGEPRRCGQGTQAQVRG